MHQKYNVLHHPPSSLFAVEILENEVDTDHLDNFKACGVFSIGVCRSELSVSTVKNTQRVIEEFLFKLALSDYDLSLKCTSKCDDEYLQCISACGSTECSVECNRASIACSEGKIQPFS